jgi:hypothetical protein
MVLMEKSLAWLGEGGPLSSPPPKRDMTSNYLLHSDVDVEI